MGDFSVAALQHKKPIDKSRFAIFLIADCARAYWARAWFYRIFGNAGQ
jgi:hypothetical protein